MVDGYSKFTTLKAVKSTATRPVINAIRDASDYAGLPSRIIVDRGSAFTSKGFRRFCADHQVELHHTATAMHRANGQVERTNQTVNAMLATTTAEGALNWDQNVKQVQWALNSTEHSTTKETPQLLAFGFEPRPMSTNKLGLALHQGQVLTGEERRVVNEKVVERLDEDQWKQKQRFDASHCKPTQYRVGDRVVVQCEPLMTGESRKLQPKFKGPYTVVRVLHGDRYIVEGNARGPTKRRYRGVQAAERMKWCHPPPGESEESTTDTSGDEEDEEESPVIEGNQGSRMSRVLDDKIESGETRRNCQATTATKSKKQQSGGEEKRIERESGGK